MMIKYSIIIPTLNGINGLKITINFILSLKRNDFELIVSDNHSDDETFNFLKSFDDTRLKVFQPPSRLPHSAHLNFAYSKATGEWVNHIGDDDLIFSNRFEYFDNLVDKANHEEADIIVGNSIRYVWPDNIYENENTVSLLNFGNVSNTYNIFKSIVYYKKMINSLTIPGGGEFILRKSVYDKLVEKLGYFCPDYPYVEFFGFRSAVFYSRKIMVVDAPFYINGRMSKSIGNVLLSNKNSFNWNFENPFGKWQYCPINTYAYNTISLDAALAVEKKIKTNYINKFYWQSISIKYALGSARGTTINNYKQSRLTILKGCFMFYPIGFPLAFLNELFIKFSTELSNYFLSSNKSNTFDHYPFFGDSVKGELLGVESIIDLANRYPEFFSKAISEKKININ